MESFLLSLVDFNKIIIMCKTWINKHQDYCSALQFASDQAVLNFSVKKSLKKMLLEIIKVKERHRFLLCCSSHTSKVPLIV